MSEITWIKLKVDMFDNEKIRLIESLPDADTIIVIWVKLLAYAGRANAGGFIMLTENVPMTSEEMATIFNRPLNTVRLALETFKRYQMIDVMENGSIHIKNWDVYQNIEGMEKIRLQTAERVRRFRDKQKSIETNENSNVNVTLRNATDKNKNREDIDKEIDKEKDKNKNTKNESIVEIVTYLNHVSGKNYRSSTPKTKKLIEARMNEGFTVDDFKKVIDVKCKQWLGDKKNDRYVRPETLFGTKFEGYLNERGTTDEPNRGFTRKSTVLDF